MDSLTHALSDPQTWLDSHGDSLYRFALLRVRDRTAAEDLVQETLLAALRARDRFAGLASERTWLISILKNKIIDHFRRNQREVSLPNDTDPDELMEATFQGRFEGHWAHTPEAWSRPDTALEQGEFWKVMQECLATLPARQAQAFMLSEIDNADTDELCKVLQASTSNVWVMLHRARLKLRECLERRWFAAGSEKD